MIFPAWQVARVIPQDVIMGLLTGQYKLYGGVIRWAAGTEHAGQIVRHVLPASTQFMNVIPGLNFLPGLVANWQLHEVKKIANLHTLQLTHLSAQVSALSQTTQQVLQIASAGAVFSGLGLAASCIGFTAVVQKLNKIDDRLKSVQKDIQAIQQFLESTERARLFAALNSLLTLDKIPEQHRHAVLHSARQTLMSTNMRYRELLLDATTIETAMAYEEYFAITALAQMRCTAELDMFEVALHEAQETNQIWQAQGRRITKEILIADHPERFLASDFVDIVSVVELVNWLDFAHSEEKGYVWLDDLRKELDEAWYAKSWVPIMHGGSGLNQNLGVGLEKEQKMIVPSIRKLIARSNVFEGYVSQYEMLAEQKMRPSSLESSIKSLSESPAFDGYIILEPVGEERVPEKIPSRKFFQMPSFTS